MITLCVTRRYSSHAEIEGYDDTSGIATPAKCATFVALGAQKDMLR